MKRTLSTLAMCMSLMASARVASSQQAASPTVSMREAMSVREYDAAGLSKLSPDEVKALDAWLTSYTRRLLVLPNSTAADRGPATQAAAVIESRIDGDFSGWEGETIFKLRNGQIWQQSSYAYTYHYAYAPKVHIYKSGASYKMKVDGVDREISVRRLK